MAVVQKSPPTVDTTTSGSVTVTLPAAPVTGNTMVLFVSGRGTTNTWTAPTGWSTAIASYNWGAGQCALFYRVVQAGDSAAVTASNGNTGSRGGVLYEITGALDQTGTAGANASGASITVAASAANSDAADTALAFVTTRNAPTIGYSSGYADDGTASDGTVISIGSAEHTESTLVTSSVTATLSTSQNAGVNLITITPGGGGGGGSTGLTMHHNGTTLTMHHNGTTLIANHG